MTIRQASAPNPPFAAPISCTQVSSELILVVSVPSNTGDTSAGEVDVWDGADAGGAVSEGGGGGLAWSIGGGNEELTGAEEMSRAEEEALMGLDASAETVVAAATPRVSACNAWEAAGPLVASLTCMKGCHVKAIVGVV